MDDIELPDPAQDFFSDSEEGSRPLEGDQVYTRLLSLPASSPDWSDLVDDLSIPRLRDLLEAYRHQERRTGAIKILERRIHRRDNRQMDGKIERRPDLKPEPQPMTAQSVADEGPDKPWFPKGWEEAREAVKQVDRPICYMCYPVYDALVENAGIFDDRWGSEEGQTCKKENVVWHWNVCFAARHPELNLKLGG